MVRQGGGFRVPMDTLLMTIASLWEVTFHCAGAVVRECGRFRDPMHTLLTPYGYPWMPHGCPMDALWRPHGPMETLWIPSGCPMDCGCAAQLESDRLGIPDDLSVEQTQNVV